MAASPRQRHPRLAFHRYRSADSCSRSVCCPRTEHGDLSGSDPHLVPGYVHVARSHHTVERERSSVRDHAVVELSPLRIRQLRQILRLRALLSSHHEEHATITTIAQKTAWCLPNASTVSPVSNSRRVQLTSRQVPYSSSTLSTGLASFMMSNPCQRAPRSIARLASGGPCRAYAYVRDQRRWACRPRAG
jgi:hypothetical protein